MVSRENKNNTYAKFGGTNKESIFQNGLFNSSLRHAKRKDLTSRPVVTEPAVKTRTGQ